MELQAKVIETDVWVRLQRALPAYATTAGALIAISFHAFVFGGADWSSYLRLATLEMLVAALICGILAGGNWPLIALCLGGPFFLIDLGLYLSSALARGDPSSFKTEMLHVGSALAAGILTGGLVAFLWRISRKGRD